MLQPSFILRQRAGCLAMCLFGGLALFAEPAWAEEIPPAAIERSKSHFLDGAAFYQSAKYEDALREFTTAYALAPLPDLLFNLAKTAEQLKRYDEAVRYLETYLEKRPDAPDRPQIEADIVRLKGKAAEKTSDLPQPTTRLVPVAPSAASPASGSSGPFGPNWKGPPLGAMGLGAGGLLFLTIGGGLGIGALVKAQDVQSAPRFDPIADRAGRDLNGAAIALDVIGAAALIGGAIWAGVWYFRDRPTASSAKTVRLVPSPTGVLLTF